MSRWIENGTMGFGNLWMVRVLVGIITLVIWIVRVIFSQRGTESSLDVARKRLARGEISLEAFEQPRSDLR